MLRDDVQAATEPNHSQLNDSQQSRSSTQPLSHKQGKKKVPLDHHLALLLSLLLSFDVSPAPLGVSWSTEGPHMTGNAAGKGRDDPPLDAVPPFQG